MAPHHGVDTSSAAAFLKAVRPGIAVISCGPDNAFGFSHTDMLDRYAKVGIRILRTGKCGAVTIITDGENISTRVFKK